jgi:hypothetical protein
MISTYSTFSFYGISSLSSNTAIICWKFMKKKSNGNGGGVE